jgi:uncharacterized protein with HEPN domain
MIEAIERIEPETADLDEAGLAHDFTRRDAVLWNLNILGQAVNPIPENVRRQNPQLPWGQIRSLRNVIVHQYDGIRQDLLWQAILELGSIKRDLIALWEPHQ